MKVFVFGGAGFVGRPLVKIFADAGCDVYSLDLISTQTETTGEPRITQLTCDISDFESVVSMMGTYRPDVVVNLSYMRETTPRHALRVNVYGMDNIFEAARICGVARVVYASSIAVNGRQKQYGDRPISEDDATYPTYQYAVHKVFNEWQAKEYREKHGMTITGIRIAHAAAPGKLVGAVDHVQCIIKPALGEAVEFKYRDTKRCVVHVNDVANVFLQVALKKQPNYTLYNTGGETLSLGELAKLVYEFVPDADIRFLNEVGGDEHSVAYRFDNSRLRSEFGIIFPPYRERVREMIRVARAA